MGELLDVEKTATTCIWWLYYLLLCNCDWNTWQKQNKGGDTIAHGSRDFSASWWGRGGNGGGGNMSDRFLHRVVVGNRIETREEVWSSKRPPQGPTSIIWVLSPKASRHSKHEFMGNSLDSSHSSVRVRWVQGRLWFPYACFLIHWTVHLCRYGPIVIYCTLAFDSMQWFGCVVSGFHSFPLMSARTLSSFVEN